MKKRILSFCEIGLKKDALNLEELESCYLIPWTDIAQNHINQLKLAKMDDKNYAFLDAEGMYMREDLTWE